MANSTAEIYVEIIAANAIAKWPLRLGKASKQKAIFAGKYTALRKVENPPLALAPGDANFLLLCQVLTASSLLITSDVIR